MKIVEANDIFREDDDDVVFIYTKVFLKEGDQPFYATVNARNTVALSIPLSAIDAIPIPAAHISPPYLPSLTRAPEPLPSDCFVKRPCLVYYGDAAGASSSDSIAALVLHEARICETLRRHPHPNVARYHRCVVDGAGRISGPCFAHYAKTLAEAVAAADRGSTRRRRGERESWLAQIANGIRHLHSLGLIHNDINPSNIMLDAAGGPVIIDFDSCQPVGQKLGLKGATSGWTSAASDAADVAKYSNYYEGLSMLHYYLTEAVPDEADE
jgi:serine/threonine protein kinase